jgi:hypothetical protein
MLERVAESACGLCFVGVVLVLWIVQVPFWERVILTTVGISFVALQMVVHRRRRIA